MKWVFKPKLRPNGEIVKYKAKLVVRGFLQKPGIDFNEVNVLVARLEIIRIVVSTATYKGGKLY